LFSTFETVAVDTPVALATSRIVTFMAGLPRAGELFSFDQIPVSRKMSDGVV
jgi:hypothetical protein